MPDSSPNHYSPFWAVWIVFLAIIFIHFGQVKALFQQKQQLQITLQEGVKAQLVATTMDSVCRDLLQMAEYSPGARQIVEECGIQLTPAPNSANPVSKPIEPAPVSKPSQPPSGNKKK